MQTEEKTKSQRIYGHEWQLSTFYPSESFLEPQTYKFYGEIKTH